MIGDFESGCAVAWVLIASVTVSEGSGWTLDGAPGRRPVPRAGRNRWEGRGSGGDRPADADLGGGHVGGQARPGWREAQPGLGFPVAVPVAVDDDAAACQVGERTITPDAGQRGGRLAVPERVAAMTARRAAVNEISRGCTGWPTRRPAADLPGAVGITGQTIGAQRDISPGYPE